ncbi:MAG: hypothetical protein SNG02_05550 [Rikenellaceae bacterium]
MIELLIDGQECSVSSSSTISLSYDMDSLVDLDEMSVGRTVSVVVPSTAVNDEILGNDGYMHAPYRFNSEDHTAVVKSDGEVLFGGRALLEGVTWEDGEMSYTVQVVGEKAEWAVYVSNNVFNAFPVELEMKLSVSRIKTQWESDDPVRFVVVLRDTYTAVQSSVSNESVREITALEDYHPFLNVDKMMRGVFESCGYSVKSEFMDSDLFKSLYMSGSYGTSTNSTETKNAMDFYVRRYEDCVTNADYRGRVYLSPYYGASSVGMIVDPDTVNTQSDCYSNGGCFVEYESVPTFVPLTQVYVGFAVRLNYITPYLIKDRTTLQAFNSIHLCVGHDYEFDVANNFEDLRGDLTTNFSYMLCVFDFEESDNIYMYFRMADGSLSLYGQITQRVTYFSSPTESFSEVLLLTATLQTYTSDWAIYGGYVQESGSTEVDVTLRITPSVVTPSSPMKFDEGYMDCGVEGWEITLKKESCITPYFYKHPGYNADITFADIAQHDNYQSKLFESMAHMFNLRYWTDQSNKRVYIEPFDAMWDQSTEWEWSEKIDTDYPIEIYDLATEVYKIRKWGYRDGDGVTSRGDGDIPADDEFGFWESEIESYAAKDSSWESLLSPLYSPSQSTDEGILQVGDRDDIDNIESLYFTPRIVSHNGEITYDNASMPCMAFYRPEDGVSLCFEDRGGVTGLNSYYQNQISIEERGRVVTLYLKLTPFDVASLFTKCEAAPDLRSIFTFEIGGERTRCLLKEVVEYDPLEESTKCRFMTID